MRNGHQLLPVAISFSSGDRIRTCDLWVMSQPVAVSSRLARLKEQVTINRPSQPSRHVSPHRGSCAAFRSQILSQDSRQQVQPPRREISSALLVAYAVALRRERRYREADELLGPEPSTASGDRGGRRSASSAWLLSLRVIGR